MYEVHTGEVLRGLNNRATPEAILAKIEQKVSGARTEEYLTRCIAYFGRLIGDAEIPIFYEYPLWKHPPADKGTVGGGEVDLIYAYRLNGEWSLGIAEAKLREKPSEALTQAIRYASRFNDSLLPKRIAALNEFMRFERREDRLFHRDEWVDLGITLPDSCRVTRIDVLGTSTWWREHQSDYVPSTARLQGECDGESIEVRRLSVPIDFYLVKGMKPQAPSVSLC